MANIINITQKDFCTDYCNDYEEKYEGVPAFIPTSTQDENLRLINKFSEGRKSIFEIGTWIGRSGLAFAQNFSKVKTIDYLPGSDIAYSYKGFESGQLCKDLDNVEYLYQDSRHYSDFSEQFDCIYVDGNHTYEGCKQDIELARKLCVEGGLIFIDDYYNSCFGVQKAVDELPDTVYCVEGTTVVFIINGEKI